MSKKIVLATDHAGFELKEHVKNITTKGFITKDNTSTKMPSGHSSCSYVLDLSN